MRLERRMTIDEIAERLALSRTTVYAWVRDLRIERTVRQSAAQRRGTAAMQAKYAHLRAEAYAAGVAEWSERSRDPTFRDFVALYLAEGSKRAPNTVAIANSDPAVVVLGDRWLRRLSERRVAYWVQYHADQDLEALRSFWAATLGTDPAAIRLQRKSNSNQLAGRTWRSEHGVLTLAVHDTLLRARLQAWLDLIRASWV
jgi:AcrR family transcriptional regulator